MKCFRSFVDAYNFKQKDPKFRIFSEEIGMGGQRHFLVSTYEEFWAMYINRNPKKYYEVISSNMPCKLYFGKFLKRE